MKLKMHHVFAAVILTLAPLGMAATNGGAMSLVPRDAVSVGVVHLAEMRTSPLSSVLFQQTDSVSAHGDAARFLKEAGLQPGKDIDLLVVAVTPTSTLGNDSRTLVAAEGRFNTDRLKQALSSRGAIEKKTENGSYLLMPEGDKAGNDDGRGAVAFVDAHLAIAGNESSVVQALTDRANGGTSFTTAGGLAQELKRVDPHATAWALVDLTRAQRLANAPHIGSKSSSAQQIGAALNHVSTVALWAIDAGNELRLGGFGIANDAETLQLLEDTLRGGLAAMRLAVQDKSPDLVSVLRRFDVKRTSDSVTISGSVPAESLKKLSENHTR